jgi:hypothetical protein
MAVLIDLKTGDPESAGARFQLAGYALAHDRHSSHLVTFDPELHEYRVKATGEVVPSVTQVLKDTGVSVDFDELSEFGSRIRKAIEVKRDIGTALHADAHAYDDHDLDWSTVHPEVEPYLKAWVAFRENYPHLQPAGRERVVYHPALKYAGTLDGLFIDNRMEATAAVITEHWSVQLMPDRRVPYRVTPYQDIYHNMMTWQAIVTTYWAGYKRRKQAA